ncbi:MAG TPA: hypothetical protein VN577_21075 [Terriglobales bacterium]|nr:hypothetical protein [Terriglobales bacterium]
MQRAAYCVFLLVACLILSAAAGELTSEKRFDKTPDEVFTAAQKAAQSMGAEVQDANSSTRTFIFKKMNSGRHEGYSGYRATLNIEQDQKGKTVARVVVTAADYSPGRMNTSASSAKLVTREFFNELRRELGLCKKCGSPVIGGGGLMIPGKKN